MKTTISLFLLLLSLGVRSQTILQMRTQPTNPTVADSVTVLVDLQFSSSGCQLDQQLLNINGTNITAGAHHCMGVAAAICNVTDTFQLGRLNSGNYTFSFTLTHHGGFGPCVPSFSISDQDTLNFSVQSTLGLENHEAAVFRVFPNPAKDRIFISTPERMITNRILIRSSLGKIVYETTQARTPFNVTQLSPGIYWVEINHNRGRSIVKFLKQD